MVALVVCQALPGLRDALPSIVVLAGAAGPRALLGIAVSNISGRLSPRISRDVPRWRGNGVPRAVPGAAGAAERPRGAGERPRGTDAARGGALSVGPAQGHGATGPAQGLWNRPVSAARAREEAISA